jgi:CrcB protein
VTPEQRREIRNLALVASGAVPGALLRWKLESSALGPVGADFAANMIGCLLIGLVLAQGPARARLALAVGIGFCGSLTTFSAWMLDLARALQAGDAGAAIAVLTTSLLLGVVLVMVGYGIGQTLQRRRLG